MKKIITEKLITDNIHLDFVSSPKLVVVKDSHNVRWMLIPDGNRYKWATLKDNGIELICSVTDWRKELQTGINKYGYTAYVFDSMAELTAWLSLALSA